MWSCQARSAVLDARQLGIKLLANVVYGYTAASFSGRMPCVDMSDAVVSTGAHLLGATIRYISRHPRWSAHVLYGDTDSVFVLLPGTPRRAASRRLSTLRVVRYAVL